MPSSPPSVFTPPSAGSPPAAPGAVYSPPSSGSPPSAPGGVFTPPAHEPQETGDMVVTLPASSSDSGVYRVSPNGEAATENGYPVYWLGSRKLYRPMFGPKWLFEGIAVPVSTSNNVARPDLATEWKYTSNNLPASGTSVVAETTGGLAAPPAIFNPQS